MGFVEPRPGGIGFSGRPTPVGISVSVPAIPLWLPEAAMREISELVVLTMRLALQEVAGRVSDEAPVSEGLLAQSFGADPATSQGGIEILGTDVNAGITGRVFSSLPYAIVMEEGRRPGAPISRLGIDAIGLWAQRKLGLSATEADDAKWAIANMIVAQGIEGKGYFEAGVNKAKISVERIFQILAEEIGQRLTTEKGNR